MKRDDLYDLAAFSVIAEHRSFTRAAAELGMSQSALSHAIKGLEERLGTRLLARTTRSVSVTEAGETLLRTLRPALDDIATGVAAMNASQGKPAGTVRITATRHAVSSILSPVLPRFFAEHPEITLDILVDDNLIDIVEERLDAGVRFGDIIDKDMIAVRIGADVKMSVVGSPDYFASHPAPQTPRDLSNHACINYRHIKTGGLYAWDFQENGRPFEVRVKGPLIVNNSDVILETALAGQGLTMAYDDVVAAHVEAGRLVRVLEAWCPTFPGYYLYHPSRRQTPPALVTLIESIRYRAP